VYTFGVSEPVRVLASVLAELRAAAREYADQECCGLLAARHGVITTFLPASNALASSTAYEIAPRELFALFRRIREERLDFAGIYHSHPSTDNIPSPRDIERAFYPDAAYFILSPRAGAPAPIRAFSIRAGRVAEFEVIAV
jgi:[CysO sulfur-carrier protein]-S-L-cysteine hydrolase